MLNPWTLFNLRMIPPLVHPSSYHKQFFFFSFSLFHFLLFWGLLFWTILNLFKYIYFIHGLGCKFYTPTLSCLTLKGFWTLVIHPFYEQVNICFKLNFKGSLDNWSSTLFMNNLILVCSSIIWTLFVYGF